MVDMFHKNLGSIFVAEKQFDGLYYSFTAYMLDCAANNAYTLMKNLGDIPNQETIFSTIDFITNKAHC